MALRLGNVDGNPDGGESFDAGGGSDVGKFFLGRVILGEDRITLNQRKNRKNGRRSTTVVGCRNLADICINILP